MVAQLIQSVIPNKTIENYLFPFHKLFLLFLNLKIINCKMSV